MLLSQISIFLFVANFSTPRIIDPNGTDLSGDDVRGEILLRGPCLMMGYLKNEAGTKCAIQDGWLHTGDVGYQRGGKWYIVDRIKVRSRSLSSISKTNEKSLTQ